MDSWYFVSCSRSRRDTHGVLRAYKAKPFRKDEYIDIIEFLVLHIIKTSFSFVAAIQMRNSCVVLCSRALYSHFTFIYTMGLYVCLDMHNVKVDRSICTWIRANQRTHTAMRQMLCVATVRAVSVRVAFEHSVTTMLYQHRHPYTHRLSSVRLPSVRLTMYACLMCVHVCESRFVGCLRHICIVCMCLFGRKFKAHTHTEYTVKLLSCSEIDMCGYAFVNPAEFVHDCIGRVHVLLWTWIVGTSSCMW